MLSIQISALPDETSILFNLIARTFLKLQILFYLQAFGCPSKPTSNHQKILLKSP
jgi:hypothetical protein